MSGSLIEQGGEQRVQLETGERVSMQVIQQLYREVTGKSERLARTFSCNHKVDFSDLENLNRKMEQLLEQYHVTAKSVTVTFYHLNDSSARFSSFDRARMVEVSNTNPTENVRIEYEFLIVLPKLDKPQPYKIAINVHSRIALIKKMSERVGFDSRFLAMLSKDSGGVSIDYVDYAVARTMLDGVVQWFEGLPQEPTPRILLLAQRYSHHIEYFLKYITAALVTYFFARSFGEMADLTIASALKYGSIAFGGIFILSGLAYRVGDVLETLVDSISGESYIKITRGDERLIEQCKKSTRVVFIRGVAAIAFAVILNVVGSLIADEIGKRL